jgi:hypothetical protein
LSSAKIWGRAPDEYLPLHQWFDESKILVADFRHRAPRHHADGILMLEHFFGSTLTLSTGRVVPARLAGEQQRARGPRRRDADRRAVPPPRAAAPAAPSRLVRGA